MSQFGSKSAARLKSKNCLEAVDAYRYQILENAVREHQIRDSFLALRAVGVEPIILKGWSVGRFYRDPGMRRLGDIDLVVGDEELCVVTTLDREEKPTAVFIAEVGMGENGTGTRKYGLPVLRRYRVTGTFFVLAIPATTEIPVITLGSLPSGKSCHSRSSIHARCGSPRSRQKL